MVFSTTSALNGISPDKHMAQKMIFFTTQENPLTRHTSNGDIVDLIILYSNFLFFRIIKLGFAFPL
jgi:hypothetical protein